MQAKRALAQMVVDNIRPTVSERLRNAIMFRLCSRHERGQKNGPATCLPSPGPDLAPTMRYARYAYLPRYVHKHKLSQPALILDAMSRVEADIGDRHLNSQERMTETKSRLCVTHPQPGPSGP